MTFPHLKRMPVISLTRNRYSRPVTKESFRALSQLTGYAQQGHVLLRHTGHNWEKLVGGGCFA